MLLAKAPLLAALMAVDAVRAAEVRDGAVDVRRDVDAVRIAAEAGQRRRVVLEGWTGSLENLRVLDLQGQDVTTAVKPQLEQGRLTLETAPAAPVVAKTREIATMRVPANKRTPLPGGLVIPPAGAAAGPQGASVAWVRLTLAASPMPAPWDGVAGGYLTRLTFGLKPSDNAPGALTLDRPVTVKLGYEGMTGPEVAPLTLDAVGLENEKSVDLTFVPLTPEPRLLVRSTISDVNLAIAALPRIDVRPARSTLPGFGLATVQVVVARVEPHGALVPAERPTNIVIEVDGPATAEPAIVTLAAGETSGSFQLRSAGLGKVFVRATGDGVSGGATIEQTFPWGPLLAALVGGALGGYARRFVKGARRAATARRVVEGLIVGLVAFVAGVLGVGYLGLPDAVVATEAGAFLTGALCGFVGVTVLEAMTRKPRPET